MISPSLAELLPSVLRLAGACRRWVIELELRDIKTTMPLAVLRCQTPQRVRQELWTGLLADNLTRQSWLQSAHAAKRWPYQLQRSRPRGRCWPTLGYSRR